jgi:excisionase family DNA binding protein
MLPDMLTKKEAADFLRISTQTLDRLRKQNLIRGVRVGGRFRFLRSDLEEFVKRQTEA